MSKLTVQVASVTDREHLVVEIWLEERLIAEVFREHDNVEIEFYPTERFTLDLKELVSTLETAERELQRGNQAGHT